MKPLPATPDFDCWSVNHDVSRVVFTPESVSLVWSDGLTSSYHALLLRENSPDPETTHPLAREMCIAPSDIASDLTITEAVIEDNGAVAVSFSDGISSSYHPGWLRGIAWFGDEPASQPILWTGEELAEPPTFDGPNALADSGVFVQWLEALRDYGVARLRQLPIEDGLLEQVVSRIGQVRETNFGRIYTLAIKDDPDSQAYTSDILPQHIDIPTRECPPGLQFLYVRENTTTGGEGLYVDSYRVAEDMREQQPEHFHSLVTDIWEYNNRSRTSDYRGWGPVVETDDRGRITGVRYNSFLRAPMKAPLDIQARAYKAHRAFCDLVQQRKYMMVLRYQPGDLLAFDNRRALHGRLGYEKTIGSRFIEGIYSDRDDLHSRIRLLRREMRQQEEAGGNLASK